MTGASSPPPSWSGRTAVVTGASRGIGQAVAVLLAEAGCRLALTGRDEAALAETAARCEAAGGERPQVVPADLTDPGQVAAVPAALDAFGGRLDLLANVAGSALRRLPLDQLEDRDWEESFALHVVAPARLQQHCRAALAAAGGAIVNVGSIAAVRGTATGGPYAAAKAALSSLTRTTAIEWARHGIRANLVEPGYVDTAFNDALLAAGVQDRLVAKTATRRPITADSVARAVVFLGSPDARDITGAILRVDGGWTAKL